MNNYPILLYDKDSNLLGEYSLEEEEIALKEAFAIGGFCRMKEGHDKDEGIFCPIVLK